MPGKGERARVSWLIAPEMRGREENDAPAQVTP